MHAYIFELSSRRVDESCWATEENFYEDHAVDYTRELTGEERDEAIDALVNDKDFPSVFRQSDDSIVSVDCSQTRRLWLERMHSALAAIDEGRGFGVYGLYDAMEQPLFGNARFCLPGWCGDTSCSPRELLDWLSTMPAGTTIYINSVFDYHF